ncbi:MAG: IS3 family transposase [Roseibacillus sp.]
MSASAKRQAVKGVVEDGVCSERQACRYLGVHRSSCRYRAQEALEQTKTLVKRIVWLSRKYPRYGYRRIRALLMREGWKAGRKFVQRIRRLEGLGIKGRGPRRRRRGHSTGSPTRAGLLNEVWSWDFVHDRTDNGGSLKMLTLIDEFSRQCLKIEVGRKLKSKDVLDALAEAMAERGVPHHIRSDNGPEFIARDVQDWLAEMGICTIYIDPGSPWQNGHVESFHNRLRDECLNQEIFLSVTEARVVIEEWRRFYNRVHPHSGLGFQSPDGFARTMAQLKPVPGT